MTRQTAFQWLLAIIVLPMTGCAMCAGPFDAQYSAEGGAWERHDPSHGRVGSAFSNAGAPRGETADLEGVPVEGEATDEAYYEASPELGAPTASIAHPTGYFRLPGGDAVMVSLAETCKPFAPAYP